MKQTDGMDLGQEATRDSFDDSDSLSDEQPAYAYDGLCAPAATVETITGDLVFLCAEPDMGKTHLSSLLMREASRQGKATYRYRLEGIPSDLACKRLARYCRNLSHRASVKNEGILAVFDGITPPDENEAYNEAKSLEKLVGAGAQTVVCLRPEAEQLIECAHGAKCLHASDLLYRQYEEDGITFDLTGGIPSLVVSLRSDRTSGEEAGLGPRYLSTLENLIDKTLRQGLPDEEVRVRLAMILLGCGTMEEAAIVAGRCDVEQMIWLERDVALLGADAHKRTFCCHGLHDDEVFDRCMGRLHGYVAAYPGLAVRACGVLASREDMRRSAMVSRLCVTERDLASVCVAWGVLYVGAGEAQMVEDAMKTARALNMSEDVRMTLGDAAALSVVGSARQVDKAWEELSKLRLSTSVEEKLYHRVIQFGACRDALRYPKQSSQLLTSQAQDATGLSCLDHLKLVRLITMGRFNEAYASVSNEMIVREPQSLFEALVCDDLRLVLAMSGGVPDAKEAYLFDRTEAFFARSGMRRLQIYHTALASIPDILMSSESNTGLLEEAVASAERAGDTFFQAVCLSVCAVADIRMHALSRAHVRASRATSILHALGEGYLASAAELIDAIALELLGEFGSFARYCETVGGQDDLALIGTILAHSTGELQHEGRDFSLPMGTPCPRDSLWILNLLERDCIMLWDGLSGVVPPAWSELLRAVRVRRCSASKSLGDDLQAGGEYAAALLEQPALGRGRQMKLLPESQQENLVHVNVLGGFAVEYKGALLPEGVLERRRARDLTMLLAVVPGHVIRRYQAIDVLWPNEDYVRGPRKLYEATGEVRRRLEERCSGFKLVLADRTQGTIGFDTTLVTFDVDEFEQVARKALMEDGDDFKVLEYARQMERIYSTGPDGRLLALGQEARERIEGMKMLYVDASVAAGEAALRLGKAKLAVRFGTDAHRMGNLREDAMILLVRALKAAGRGFEVGDLFRRYSQQVIEATGVPPSRALRRAVELALGDGGEGFTA
ncbi:MAG: bacterial transcriptional activator domain-containing protein [Atopobiaceae bacterium]|nr:bacterial transcriptional activator domain-containing protein [Atopobiaceae bacterium]